MCKNPGTLDGLLTDYTLFVPENICFICEEDLTLPKRDRRQTEKNCPCHTHQDNHYSVQVKEAWDLKRIAEDAQTRNPAHVRERQGPTYEDTKSRKGQYLLREYSRGERRLLTSKDLTKVLVDFEPVWQQSKGEEEYGKAEEEESYEHARRKPDLASKRRDEIVLRKATELRNEWISASGQKMPMEKGITSNILRA